jgi:hypothetical protein
MLLLLLLLLQVACLASSHTSRQVATPTIRQAVVPLTIRQVATLHHTTHQAAAIPTTLQ